MCSINVSCIHETRAGSQLPFTAESTPHFPCVTCTATCGRAANASPLRVCLDVNGFSLPRTLISHQHQQVLLRSVSGHHDELHLRAHRARRRCAWPGLQVLPLQQWHRSTNAQQNVDEGRRPTSRENLCNVHLQGLDVTDRHHQALRVDDPKTLDQEIDPAAPRDTSQSLPGDAHVPPS